MPDLTDALEELRRQTPEAAPWSHHDFTASHPQLREQLPAILNAVLSGEMIPLAHHNAMIGAIVEKAAEIAYKWHVGIAVDMIRALTPTDARAALDEAISRARKEGWRACINHLMQGGSQTGCDFHNAAGQVIGRFNGFFPAGATHDEKAAHYEVMAKMEIASKTAVPFSFGDGTGDAALRTGETG